MYWNHNSAYYPWIQKRTGKCETILDVGCGDGSLALFLDDGKKKITGIDADSHCIEKAISNNNGSNVDFYCYSFEDYSPNEKFDAIVFVASIHHMDMTEALQNVYDRLGWTLTSFGPTRAKAGARQPVFPTLDDFVKEVEKITAERGYAGENAANVNAAIQGRLKNLLLGSVGDMLNCERSTPLDELFSCATILELNDLNEQDKSLVTMFLLATI